MRHALPQRHGFALALALDSFDAPEPETEQLAEDPLPALLEDARASGYAAGEAAGRRAAAATIEVVVAASLQDAARGLAAAADAAAACAEESAAAAAQAAFAALGAALPSLTDRFAEAEVARFVALLLPAFRAEPLVTLWVAPELAATMAAHFAAEPRIEVAGDRQLGRADVRVEWRDGAAERRAAMAADAVRAALIDFGLLQEA
jgi:hypothetical protein